jgi:hypothetical protein
MKTSSVIIATIFAGTAGVITGVLLATGKGAKPKTKFARKSQEYKEFLLDNFNEFTDFVSHPFENLEEETKRLSRRANAKAKRIVPEINQEFN